MNPAQLNPTDPLAQLRDIHLPEPISWWPPAPGWWILALLLISALSYGLYRFFQWRNNNLYRRQALAELENSYACHKDDPTTFSHQVLALLRRTTRAAFPLKKLASASTDKLLEQISNSAIETGFHRELRQQLTSLPYQSKAEFPTGFSDDLYRATRQWIKHHPGKPSC